MLVLMLSEIYNCISRYERLAVAWKSLFWLGDTHTHTHTHTQLLRLCLFLSRPVFLCDHWVITWLAASSIKHEPQTCKCRLCLVLTTGVSVCVCVCVCVCFSLLLFCPQDLSFSCFPLIVYVSSCAVHSCSTALHFKRPGVVLDTLYLHRLEVLATLYQSGTSSVSCRVWKLLQNVFRNTFQELFKTIFRGAILQTSCLVA